MISKLSYVCCDECGDPDEGSVEGAAAARRAARSKGYKRRGGRDLCENCWRAEDGYVYDRGAGWVLAERPQETERP